VSVKHALLVLGEKRSAVDAAGKLVKGFLEKRSFVVEVLLPSSPSEVTSKLESYAKISCDPNTNPKWSQFLYYFIGHGGQGLMELTNPANGKALGTIMTDDMAAKAFDLCVDEWTYVFDMCQAWDAVNWIRQAASKSGKQPQGWILTASGTGNTRPHGFTGALGAISRVGQWIAELEGLGLSRDVSATRDEYYSSALDECLNGSALAADLADCLWQKRFKDPWWWNKSVTAVSKLDYSQPKDVPVF